MRHLTANGVSTAYDVTGSGPPLVLIHGAEADSRMFGPLAGLLAARAAVIVYDQRDCGLTRHAVDTYTLADMADDAAALIDGLGFGPAHVFGQSLGGMIAQVLAVRHPDRVDRLVLGSTMRIGSALPELNPAAARAVLACRAEGEAGVAKLAALFTTSQFVAETPGFVEVWRGIAPITTAEQRARRMAAIRRPIVPVDLARIECPTLVLVGDGDQVVPPAHTRSIAEAIPGAVCRVMPGVGHVGPLQAPDLVAKEIATFLHV